MTFGDVAQPFTATELVEVARDYSLCKSDAVANRLLATIADREASAERWANAAAAKDEEIARLRESCGTPEACANGRCQSAKSAWKAQQIAAAGRDESRARVAQLEAVLGSIVTVREPSRARDIAAEFFLQDALKGTP